MKNIITSIIISLCMLVGCAPAEYALGEIDILPSELVEGKAFRIEHDAQNPNIIHLVSLIDKKYQPLWDHPQGRSQNQRVSLNMPFPGEYEVKFGVQTRGGVVYGAPTKFKVENFYAPFVDDELWTLISGGVDQEKTWVLDLDEDGLSRHFAGPLFFYGTNNGWLGDCTKPDGDCWNWSPDYKGNSWLMNAGDYGTMTFDLKGGANIKVNHKMLSNRQDKGFYMLDTENKTLQLTGAAPLHDSNRDKQVIDWGKITIISLTKDYMQLGVLRDEALSGEGPALLVYNYISKDFKDNWKPGETVEPEPAYNGDANTDLTSATTTTKKWVLSKVNPYDWADLAGEILNGWSTPEDYEATGWTPYDANVIKNVSLTLSKKGDKDGTYTFTDGMGKTISGSYQTDDKNNIIFDKHIAFSISGWVNLSTTEEKTLRIIKAEKDNNGQVVGIWLGQRDPVKAEYMAYHFVINN